MGRFLRVHPVLVCVGACANMNDIASSLCVYTTAFSHS